MHWPSLRWPAPRRRVRGGAIDAPALAWLAPGLSVDAQRLLQWIRQLRRPGGLPFIVIDKRRAHLWLFDADGSLHGDTPVLLGLAQGDHSVPGIGERPMSRIRSHERTTPAGRFVIEAGRNLNGEDIFWIDYDAAVSLHRVRTVSARNVVCSDWPRRPRPTTAFPTVASTCRCPSSKSASLHC